ncbi:hypothetical protein Vadar_011764 [Vaccinium darrowii]|uniref:Uncharacterized protein n=1 Tax=Vaccinium darrowii TaxID=229202 RepID=A0ACB7ZB28_9ERIC|nr:hypothetical protein Vadar_011764 [Vaccinium darrowii]
MQSNGPRMYSAWPRGTIAFQRSEFTFSVSRTTVAVIESHSSTSPPPSPSPSPFSLKSESSTNPHRHDHLHLPPRRPSTPLTPFHQLPHPHRHVHPQPPPTATIGVESACVLLNANLVSSFNLAETRALVFARKNKFDAKYKSKLQVMANLAKQEQDKRKGLPVWKPRKGKVQTRVQLKAIVGIVKNFSDQQCDAVRQIGLGGILQLRLTVLNHHLCDWLVNKFDPDSSSIMFHGRTFLLTESEVHQCLGINAEGNPLVETVSQRYYDLCDFLKCEKGAIKLSRLREDLKSMKEANQVFKISFALYILGAFLCPTTRDAINQSFVHAVIDVETMEKMNWAKLTLDFLCKGIREKRRDGRVQGNGCLFLLMVFYFERVSPIQMVDPYVRTVPCLAAWGDSETKEILRRFRNIGGYDTEGVVVHFLTEEGRVEEKSDGHERGEFERGAGDLAGLNANCTLATLPKSDEKVDPNKHASTYPTPNPVRLTRTKDPNEGQGKLSPGTPITGVRHCSRTPTPTTVKTPKLVVDNSKDPEEGNCNLSPRTPVMGVKHCRRTSTPSPLGTMTGAKRSIEVDIDDSQQSPSPISAFNQHGLLSRDRESELSNSKLRRSLHLHNDVELPYEPPPLRQPGELTRGHYLSVTYTKDGVKNKAALKIRPQTESTNNMDEDAQVAQPNVVQQVIPGTESFVLRRVKTPRKRSIEADIDDSQWSPSPISNFKTLGLLSRGRKSKLSNSDFRRSLHLHKDVELPYGPPRLRQPGELTRGHYLSTPYTKDRVKKAKALKIQPRTESTNNMDGDAHVAQPNVVQEVIPGMKSFVLPSENIHNFSTPERLDDDDKLLTAFIFDSQLECTGEPYLTMDLFSRERFHATRSELSSLKPLAWIQDTTIILGKTKLDAWDVKKMCEDYFGETNYTADIRSCSWVDVSKFNIANVGSQPLQHGDDRYFCNLLLVLFAETSFLALLT